MVFGLGFGKGKKTVAEKQRQIDNSQQVIAGLQQEKQDLEARLAQMQEEHRQKLEEQQTRFGERYTQLQREKQAIEKITEKKIQKASDLKKLEGEYEARIITLEGKKQTLESGLRRKLNEFGRHKRESADEQAKLNREIEKLKEGLENKERQYQEYIQGLPKIEKRITEIAKKKKYELLVEGDIVTVTIYEHIEEERRENGYKALGPSGEIFYVRTSKTYIIGEDVIVIVKTLPVAEASIIDNPDIKLEVGKIIDFKNLDIYERTENGLSAICKGGTKLIIEVGEHVTGLGNKKIEVYKEEEGVFYAKRV